MKPKSRGGGLGQNVLYVCWQCNQDKAALSLAQFHAKLEAASDRRAAIVGRFIAEARSNIHVEFDPTL